MKSLQYIFIYLLVSSLFFSSCKKFVEVDLPNTQITKDAVFQNDQTAIAAATGMYYSMLRRGHVIGQSFNPLSYVGGISSDELKDLTGTSPYGEFYSNDINTNNAAVFSIWSSAYNTIYESNAVMEGISTSSTLSPSIKIQLEGEAKFVRALNYFYLVNLFGDIPLILSTNYQQNAGAFRSAASNVYAQIVNDLKDAQQLLTESYFNGMKVRPNKHAATALLARVYLYMKEYARAENEASIVINSGSYAMESDLNKVFLSNSSEAILQLPQEHPNGFPTADGQTFYVSSSFGSTKDVEPGLLNSFETNDLRKVNWFLTQTVNLGTFTRPYKYKVRVYFADANYPERLVILRLAEQYLIRAEARANQNNIAGAQSDINVIRTRAFGTPNPTTANDKASLLAAIESERRFELCCEMGHRWMDLKRTERATAVLAPIKPGFQPTDVLYPIPEAELNKNPNLTQNTGY